MSWGPANPQSQPVSPFPCCQVADVVLVMKGQLQAGSQMWWLLIGMGLVAVGLVTIQPLSRDPKLSCLQGPGRGTGEQ